MFHRKTRRREAIRGLDIRTAKSSRLPAFLLQLILVLSTWIDASVAAAGVEASVPAGGGLGALDVKVDLAGAVVVAGSTTLPIPLERSLIPEEGDVTVEAVALGRGRKAIHVRVPVRGSAPSGPAWE